MSPNPSHSEVRTRTADEAVDLLRSAYGTGLRMSGTDGSQEFVLRHTDTGRFGYSEVLLPTRLTFGNDSRGAVVIMTTTGGRAERSCGTEHGSFTTGDVWLANAPERPYRARTEDLEAITVTLPADLLAQAAEEADPRHRGPLRFTGLTPATADAAAVWERARSYAGVVCAARTPSSPLVRESAAHLLTATALQVFPNNVVGKDPSLADTRDATPATVSRARTYIEDNAHTPLTLKDIAEAAHVTPRALQYAFRRHLDTTPLAHLRGVRLAYAHEDLKAAEPHSGVTVTSIAAHWGFVHSGHFAALYREAYGTSPSTTLRTPPTAPRI
ncbi:helix-turn-helix transcriptional regulator [Streptomyces sp. NPDC046716]|uniref:helix-turn-helix domain-containing protein n=1 Tax=Streptomyces sp. NPDC046716 TaxID=3157093 RepID=UPI00340B2ED0